MIVNVLLKIKFESKFGQRRGVEKKMIEQVRYKMSKYEEQIIKLGIFKVHDLFKHSLLPVESACPFPV